VTALTSPNAHPWRARLAHERPALGAASSSLAVAYVAIAAVLTVTGLALLHVGLLAPVVRWDHDVSVWFAEHRTSTLDRASDVFTWAANTSGIIAADVVVTAFLLWRRWGRRALVLTMGLALELSCFLTGNYLVRRDRPSVPRVGTAPSTFSWPSGHCAATLVLYGGIAVLVATATRRLVPRIASAAVAVVLSLGVATSRVYRGEHHLLDVVAGLAVGIAALVCAFVAMRRMEECAP